MSAVVLPLTADQIALVEPHLTTGVVLLGRVTREPFAGDNADTSGRLALELGTVPEIALPALRIAIRTATKPRPVRRRSGKAATPARP